MRILLGVLTVRSLDRNYPRLNEEANVAAARDVRRQGERKFSIVASGLSMQNSRELERVGNAIARIRADVGLETCVSLGRLTAEQISFLLSRGLRSVHHNLETVRGFFPPFARHTI